MTFAYPCVPRIEIPFSPQYATKGISEYPVKFNPQLVSVVDDPILGAARKVLKFGPVHDTDSAASTVDPRCQLQGPNNIHNGDEFWVGWATLLPVGFPAVPIPNGWINLLQLYGAPTQGTPSFRIAFENDGGLFGWKRAPAQGAESWACKITPQYGAWMDFAVHFLMSPNPAVGFVEIWTNFGGGWVQRPMTASPSNGDTLSQDGKRLYTTTITSANYIGPSRTDVQLYRKVGMFEQASLHHAAHRQAFSLQDVDPHSYG